MPGNMHDVPSEPPPSLRQLLPPDTNVDVQRLVDGLDLAERAAAGRSSRPYLVLNMISSIDGRATLGGRSGPLGGRADSELLHGLRTTVDAVMAGAVASACHHPRSPGDPALHEAVFPTARRHSGIAGPKPEAARSATRPLWSVSKSSPAASFIRASEDLGQISNLSP